METANKIDMRNGSPFNDAGFHKVFWEHPRYDHEE